MMMKPQNISAFIMSTKIGILSFLPAVFSYEPKKSFLKDQHGETGKGFQFHPGFYDSNSAHKVLAIY